MNSAILDVVEQYQAAFMDALLERFDHLSRDVMEEVWAEVKKTKVRKTKRKKQTIPSAYVLFSREKRKSEALKQLEAKFGRAPADAEVAEHMGLSREEFEKLLIEANAVSLVSLNKKWCETDSSKEVHEIDILEDKKGEDPTRRIQKSDLMRLVTKGLNRNERLIIILYYYEELTMKEIGATLDLSESRVSQMHSAIVERLQGQLGRRKPEFAM
jgi:RNA polymerase sigma factor for flagellar operon FliA